MTARLPTPGVDRTGWGTTLNEFLGVSHDANGTLKLARALGLAMAEDYGLDTTGATVHTAAQVQAWLDAGRAYAAGTISCSEPVVIKDDCDLSRLVWNYTGTTGTAIQIGIGTSGTILFRKTIRLPQITATAKSGTGWASVAGTIGVKAVNTFGCVIWVPRIQNFETGYYAYGLGTGNVYNEVHLLHLDNNKRNLVLGAGTGGWSNSNSYFLGVLTQNSGEGTAVSGVRCILCEVAANAVNANFFLGGSVEGSVPEYHVEDNGNYNIYDGVRWEVPAGARVLWGATAARNEIRFGYSAHTIVETHTAGSNYNQLSTTGMSRRVGTTSKAVQWLENVSSSTAFADVVMDPGATLAGSDAATAYRVARSGDATKMKRASESFDRIVLDHVNSRIYLGSGAVAPVRYLANVGTSAISMNAGDFVAGVDNTLDIGQSGALRFRDLNLARNAVIGGNLDHDGSNVGFYGTAPAAKPTITGSRGGNAALASLLTALAGLGLITDSSSA